MTKKDGRAVREYQLGLLAAAPGLASQPTDSPGASHFSTFRPQTTSPKGPSRLRCRRWWTGETGRLEGTSCTLWMEWDRCRTAAFFHILLFNSLVGHVRCGEFLRAGGCAPRQWNPRHRHHDAGDRPSFLCAFFGSRPVHLSLALACIVGAQGPLRAVGSANRLCDWPGFRWVLTGLDAKAPVPVDGGGPPLQGAHAPMRVPSDGLRRPN